MGGYWLRMDDAERGTWPWARVYRIVNGDGGDGLWVKQARGGASGEGSWDSGMHLELQDMARVVGDGWKASAHAQSNVFWHARVVVTIGKAFFGGFLA